MWAGHTPPLGDWRLVIAGESEGGFSSLSGVSKFFPQRAREPIWEACLNYPPLLICHEGSHRQHANEGAWPCANKALLTDTEI